MRGAALWFAEQLDRGGDSADLILTSDMLNVADLGALLPSPLRCVPVLTYFHENQLTYPLPDEADRDFSYGFTNITSAMTSQAIWFNSRFHRRSFLDAAAQLLRRMPDHVPDRVVDTIAARSVVMYPLIETPPEPDAHQRQPGPVRLLWNHRWEYDKNPEEFFQAIISLADNGHDFRLLILGEQFREAPKVFAASWPRIQSKLEHAGYLPTRDAYWTTLASCDVVLSTAIQENFGLAVAEAIAAGCTPLVPDRLSYPELIPEPYHAPCLYRDAEDLLKRLIDHARGHADRVPGLAAEIRGRFGVVPNIARYDTALQAVASNARAENDGT
jgi:glycosyltransferase involved in cell wall biosynthesis